MGEPTFTSHLCCNQTPGAPKYRIYYRGTLVYSGELRFFLADHPEMTEASLFPTEGSPGGESALSYASEGSPLRVFNSGRPPKNVWVVPAEEDERVCAFYFRDHFLEFATLEEFLVGHQHGGYKLWWDRKLSAYVGAGGEKYPRLADYFQAKLAPSGLSYQPRVAVVPFEPRFPE